MTIKILTQDYLKSILRYDSVTGFLYWTVKPCKGIQPGTRAGRLHKATGYIHIRINRKSYQAHRIIWLMVFGEWPKEEIDHINHIKHDNRIDNLRSVNTQENCQNRKLPSNNTSGVIGVYWYKSNKKWWASICVSGKRIFLGQFDDWFSAACARKSAEIKYGFHPNHGLPRNYYA